MCLLSVWRGVFLNPNNMIRNTFFWRLMPKSKLVSGSLSQMMKVCENLKSAIHRWRVAFCIHDIGDPSAVHWCTAAGSILVLWWSSIILYILMYINEIVTPELIKALNLFPAWAITLRQSEASPIPIVNWWVDNHPPHSFESSSLLEEDPQVF